MSTAATGQPRRERLPILALLGANAISLVGSQFTLIAVPWFVLLTTGSNRLISSSGRDSIAGEVAHERPIRPRS